MKYFSIYIFTAIAALFLTACHEETLSVERLGEVSYYDEFWPCGADTTSLTKTFSFNFNADAQAKGENSYAEFAFVDMNGSPISPMELQITQNGQILAQNRFIVTADNPEAILTFTYLPSAQSGRHQGMLRLVSSNNLDRIGSCELDKSESVDLFKWVIEFDKSWNPLATVLFWLIVSLIVALIIWFIILRPQMYPHFGTFRKSVLIQKDGINVCQINCVFTGCRKVVFASSQVKQSLWNRIFIGEIKTVVNPLFTIPLTITAKKKGMTGMAYGMGYIVRSNPIPRNGMSIIENAQQKLKMTMN